MTTTPAAVLRLAQAVPETPESFLIVRELIKALEDLVAIANRSAQ
jgi:hypothetical protein